MRLTTFSDYTLRVLMYLALDPERRVTIPEIAVAYGISESHLTKVVHQLGRSGVVEAIRGKGGGVRLARPPQEIRLGQILRTTEGSTPLVECLSPEASACRITPVCRLTRILVEAFDALYDGLDAYTLADLVTHPGILRQVLVAGSAS